MFINSEGVCRLQVWPFFKKLRFYQIELSKVGDTYFGHKDQAECEGIGQPDQSRHQGVVGISLLQNERHWGAHKRQDQDVVNAET